MSTYSVCRETAINVLYMCVHVHIHMCYIMYPISHVHVCILIGVATPGPKGAMAQAIISIYYYNNNDIHSFNGCGKHVDSH